MSDPIKHPQPVTAPIDIEIADPQHPNAQYCMRAYFDELSQRFDAGFDPARSISATVEEVTLPHGLFLVATRSGVPVGCAALKFDPAGGIAEAKRMWVSPDVRGAGLGRRLLIHLEREASSRGVGILRLETNRALTEAIQLYRSAGFREVSAFNHEPYAHLWFEKHLDGGTEPGEPTHAGSRSSG